MMDKAWMDIIMGYAVAADEAALGGGSLQMWEYIEDSSAPQELMMLMDLRALLCDFYTEETVDIMLDRWGLGKSYMDGESGD